MIAALNDLSITDVQTALTNQGYTVARAANLDNIDTAFSDRLILIEKILRNRWEVDPSDGSATLYDDDSSTPLLTTTVFQDVAGVQTYQNQGANRRNRLV